MKIQLSETAHPRDVLGMRYVYLVRSRRAGGISLGVNLSPHKRCNFRCVYCQVEGLRRGGGVRCDLDQLREELARAWAMLDAPLADIAFSGDGEPLACPNVDEAVALVAAFARAHGFTGPIRMITNASYITKPHAERALLRLAEAGGEAWCKLDAVGEAETRAIHGVRIAEAQALAWLVRCARMAPSWVQTCVFLLDGQFSCAGEARRRYLALLARAAQAAPLRGVWLYGLARPAQVAPERVARAPRAWVEAMADEIRAHTGLEVRVCA